MLKIEQCTKWLRQLTFRPKEILDRHPEPAKCSNWTTSGRYHQKYSEVGKCELTVFETGTVKCERTVYFNAAIPTAELANFSSQIGVQFSSRAANRLLGLRYCAASDVVLAYVGAYDTKVQAICDSKVRRATFPQATSTDVETSQTF